MPGAPTPLGAAPPPNKTNATQTPRGYTPPEAFHPSTTPYAYRPEDPASSTGSHDTTGASVHPAPEYDHPQERPGSPDLSIFGAKIPLEPSTENGSTGEHPTALETTQQMPEVTRAFDAVEQAVEQAAEVEAYSEEARDEPADPPLPSVIEPWMFEHPETASPAAAEPTLPEPEAQRPRETMAWDELAPEMRSDRPGRPLYRIEDPMVKDEPASPIERQQQFESPQLRFEDPQLRFEDLTARYGPAVRDEPPAEDHVRSTQQEPAGWRREAESYEQETQLFGDGSVVDWSAIEDADRDTNGHTEAEPKPRKRVLQWQSGGEQVIAAERRASILKNTSAKAKIKAADEAMIVEDGLVYVLVDDEGQPVLH